MLTEDQLEQRLNYVCGSDCATILGLNPWSNRVKLWQEKTRRIVSEDISDKPSVKAGNFLESAVRAWFEAESGLKVTEEPSMLIHPEHPWMAGNIDGWVGENKDEILEIKTCSNDTGWGRQGENVIPYHYLCQITHYMAVTSAKVCHVAVLIRGSDFRTYKFLRNEELEKIIIQKEKAFWDLVVSDMPPAPVNSDEIISFHGYTSVPETIIADIGIDEAIIELENIKNSIKSKEKEKELIEAKIKLFMGKNEVLADSSGKILATWKSSGPIKRFDTSSFKKENEEEYLKYIKETESSRRFLVRQTQEGI